MRDLQGLSNCAILSFSKRGGANPQQDPEVRPMSVTETIALLMLVIAAITLGNNLKK